MKLRGAVKQADARRRSMKRQLTGVMFFLIAVITCGLNVFFAPPVNAQVQGACASAPCDCTSVGAAATLLIPGGAITRPAITSA